MQVKWKKLLVTTLIWLTTEIWLNTTGLDTLADYSEFIFDKSTLISTASINKVVKLHSLNNPLLFVGYTEKI